MKYYIKIFGCEYNEWDAARISFLLHNLGFYEAAEDQAEIIVVLLCSVRKTAVDKALGKIRNWSDKKVIITGCLLPTDQPRFLKKNAFFWDGQDVDALAQMLSINISSFRQSPRRPRNPSIIETTTGPLGHRLLRDDTINSNLIPIMKGCNNFCSYCAVPYTRGRELSREPKEVLRDAKKLIDSGHKEILLLGQNVNSYEYGFADLLKKIDGIPGNFTVKFTSNHPKDMTDEIIDAIAALPKIAKSIHLPLQSGSNHVLKAMNRPYTKENYLQIIENIRAKIPRASITTDFIVGFPTETEDDFNETVSMCQKIGFFSAYINKYSPREGTKAFVLGDPILWSEKQRRWWILNKLVNK